MGSDVNALAVCEAVLREISRATGLDLGIVDRPEDRTHNEPAVDFIARGDDIEYAVEHTRIESFPGQMRDSDQLRRVLGPVMTELADVLPPGQFTFGVRPGEVAKVRRSEEDSAREQIKAWAATAAPDLAYGGPRTAPEHFVRGSPPDLPFDLSLYRWPERAARPRVAVVPDRPMALLIFGACASGQPSRRRHLSSPLSGC